MTSVECSKPTNKYNLKPFPASIIPLHNLDFISGPKQIHHHRFFHPPTAKQSFYEIVNELKSSLAEALEFYPPVAGTIRESESGHPVISLDGEGTPFIVDVKGTRFDGDSIDLSPRSSGSLPMSVLAVKVTLFSCGTIAVCSSLHHWASDLGGFYGFLQLWAKICRDHGVNPQTITIDYSHTPGRFFNNVPEYNATTPPSPPKGHRAFAPYKEPHFGPFDVQTWSITANDLAKLKADITAASSDNRLSTGDILTAFVWGAITRARESGQVPHTGGFGRSSEESGLETIATTANARGCAPNKDMWHYFGNFFFLLMTTVPRVDLISTEATALTRVALALRKTLDEQLSLPSTVNRLRFMEIPEHKGNVSWWNCDFVLTNCCQFDLLDDSMNFGFGMKLFDTTIGSEWSPGNARLFLKKKTGEVKLMIAIEMEGAMAMKSDPLLTKYASLLSSPFSSKL